MATTLTFFTLLMALFVPASWCFENRTMVDYRLSMVNYQSQRAFQCTQPGITCKNCRNLVMCNKDGDDYVETDLGPCDSGKVCIEGSCVTPSSSDECKSPVDDLSFICSSVGMFPDPVRCNFYHFCVPSDVGQTEFTSTEVECLEDLTDKYFYDYNAKTTYCDKRRPKGDECKGYPIPLCTQFGETHAVIDNPTIYYTCAKHMDSPEELYPYQRTCPHGQKFDNVARACK